MLFALAIISALGTPATHATRERPDSVIHDSIYSLAVKPSDFPKQSFVWLLDEGVYKVEPDGRARTTVRQVIQILKASGAIPYREQRLSYDPAHQRLTVNWMRVVKRTGEVISAAPTQVQESDVPASMGSPVYTSTKVKRMSLSGLDSGTVLDYSYSIDELEPAMPRDFFFGWRVTTPVPVQRSLLVLDVPQGFHPRIEENHLTFARTEQTIGGRTLYRWATDKVLPSKVEMFAPDSSIKVVTVSISPPFGWDAIGKWYAPIVESRYEITPAVAKKIHEVVASAKNLDDSVAAIHKWVASDIRYVSIALGRGGYVPRDAAAVTQSGFGDCKDKTMLFLAALRSIGVKGYPVLLNTLTKVDEKAPTINVFNHMIAAVQGRNGYVFTDLTDSQLPYGQLSQSERGKFGLILRGSAADTAHLPDTFAKETTNDIRVTGSIAADGAFNGYFTVGWTGSNVGVTTSVLARQRDSSMRASFARSMASSVLDGGEGDSLTVTTSDSSRAFTIHLRIKSAKVTSETGTLELVSNPIKPLTLPAMLAAQLEHAEQRTLPIDIARLMLGSNGRREARITLPIGWRVILPKSVSSSSLIGKVEVTYGQVGNELRISQIISGGEGVVGPERIADVIAALKAISTSTARTLAIQTQ
jgi:transglutaminase-like putative cysteine protease